MPCRRPHLVGALVPNVDQVEVRMEWVLPRTVVARLSAAGGKCLIQDRVIEEPAEMFELPPTNPPEPRGRRSCRPRQRRPVRAQPGRGRPRTAAAGHRRRRSRPWVGPAPREGNP